MPSSAENGDSRVDLSKLTEEQKEWLVGSAGNPTTQFSSYTNNLSGKLPHGVLRGPFVGHWQFQKITLTTSNGKLDIHSEDELIGIRSKLNELKEVSNVTNESVGSQKDRTNSVKPAQVPKYLSPRVWLALMAIVNTVKKVWQYLMPSSTKQSPQSPMSQRGKKDGAGRPGSQMSGKI